ncbi:MAG: tRNA uridine-5-carboxymethylaminomethyl(34) synthesis GTPase MnmE [Magnetospirillum sp. WYHS-4]
MGDTIFALASGGLPAAVAIIRVSGPQAAPILQRLTGKPLPTPRRAIRSRIEDPATGETLDDGLVLWFPGPASFTGEDVVEFQLHGGRAVVAGVLEVLGREGLRPAEAGEFARRAFGSGRLDLTEVEGLADLVNAETAAQRRQALRQMEGALGRQYDAWREELLRAQAYLEAAIDFSEEDLPADLEAEVTSLVASANRGIGDHLADGRRGEILRDGFRIAIVGAPNSGKSSLLNALARREAAIVSERAGTTRDVIEVRMDLAGYPVILADTAGLRDSDDEIEQEGIRRAKAHAAGADLRLAIFSAEVWPDQDAATLALVGPDTLSVLNKVDLMDKEEECQAPTRGLIPISARGGRGVDLLLARIAEEVRTRTTGNGDGAAMTRTRHRRALESCQSALARFVSAEGVELRAEELRTAAQALGTLTGRVGVEELLDVIFRDFCIGK